jgi:hypothetical protein
VDVAFARDALDSGADDDSTRGDPLVDEGSRDSTSRSDWCIR